MTATDKIILAIGTLHEATADEIARETGISRGSVSQYLPKLWHGDYLHRVKQPHPACLKPVLTYSLAYRGNTHLKRLQDLDLFADPCPEPEPKPEPKPKPKPAPAPEPPKPQRPDKPGLLNLKDAWRDRYARRTLADEIHPAPGHCVRCGKPAFNAQGTLCRQHTLELARMQPEQRNGINNDISREFEARTLATIKENSQ